MNISRRARAIAPFHVMDILARARALEAQGRDIIHLEVGEPDFPTPEPMLQAAMQAIRGGDVHYTPALGLPELREAIAAFYRTRYGIELPAARIAVTPGASGALLLALGALLDSGDEILLADPGYPCNRHFAAFIDATPVRIPVGPETAFQLTPQLVEQHWTERTKAVLIASPSNPTGTLARDEDIRDITALCSKRGATLIVDEIYHGLVYEGSPQTALAHADDVIVINSFSKYFHMTGWRLGWLAAPTGLMNGIDRLAQNLYLAPPTPAQYAALAAFSEETLEILEARRLEMKTRRDFMLPALRELGFGLPVTPQGAFYLYADVSRFAGDSFAFAERMLADVGVAITPGVDFGETQPERYVRFAYTRPLPVLQESMERIRNFLAGKRA
ncbi:MAG: pyridoxal phosphate-dependent aminotransferase [Pseudomonadota bacterium]